MAGEAGFFPSFGEGPRTQNAGTIILLPVKPHRRYKTKLMNLVYTSSSTAHTLTVMRPLAKTTVVTAVAASGTTVKLARDPGAYAANRVADNLPVTKTADNLVAANDYFAFLCPDGTLHVTLISAATTNADGTVSVTISTAAPTGGLPAGTPVWFFGVIGDTDPNTGLAHPAFAPTTSATTTFSNAAGGGLVQTFTPFAPLLIHSGNASNAGTIVNAGGIYAN